MGRLLDLFVTEGGTANGHILLNLLTCSANLFACLVDSHPEINFENKAK